MTTESPLTFEVYRDANDEWRWRALTDDPDDRILADSGEGYATRGQALTALQHLRSYAGDADAIEVADAGHQFRHDLTIEMEASDT